MSNTQEAKSFRDVQQVIKQIAKQTASGGGDVNQIINQISTQIANNPKSDLAI